ncbi:MAG: PHP domain protein [Microgenomates group bacterium GW2011_GWB1_40_9]|nr:MAG: PHP domain protein [Microgenomates group bacterium GW2011_GWC1_39_12]KKR78926.1 MAG: PHP domain protein [Microgenomates group bacterium GW2011_GWB1_40_9]
MTNLQLATLFRNIAAVYQIKEENRFRIIAYEKAADSIEHLTSEAKDYWDDGKVNEIPGIGPTIASHLDELFRTGHAKHFDKTLVQVPVSTFPLLLVSGIGPKRAYRLVTELKLTNEHTVVEDLLKAAGAHKIASLEGFGEKSEEEIVKNIQSYQKGGIKENRITLVEADEIALAIKTYLLQDKCIQKVDVLGSLRRRVATIGDIDLAIITSNSQKAIKHFCAYRHEKIIEQGPTGASILLTNGRQVDMRVQAADSYGAMLQYFTGSKNHNIKLRTFALTKHKSLSEYGIKTSRGLKKFEDEKDFYHELDMDWIPPELREDKGEIQAAIGHKLPHLVEDKDIKGDLHIHTSYDLDSSHDLGDSDITEVLDTASILGYEYIGISDHNPSTGNHTEKEIISIMKRRKEYYENKYTSWKKKNNKDVQLFIMLEIDIQPDGELALPNEAFEYIDAAIISVHSSFQQSRKDMTKRVIKAMHAHPKIRIFGHPTGRLLTKREEYELDWKEIFAICKQKNIALEINSHPYRLDLPDALVHEAVFKQVPLVINSDTHAIDSMQLMPYGVSVARRGWATKDDILNTLSYNKIKGWLMPQRREKI